jgi:hypothetical protein
VVGAAISVGRIAMAWEEDLRLQVRGAGDGRVEVADLEPQEHAVSRRELRVADGTVMMLHVPAV